MGPLQTVDATINVLDSTLNGKLPFILIEAVYYNLSVIASCAEQVRISNISTAENPRVTTVQSFQTVNRFLLVHHPKVNRVVLRCCVEELVGQDMNAANMVFRVIVEKF